MAYQKINFQDRIDTKPSSYLIDGEIKSIEKDSSGVKQEGSNLNADNLNHIEDGILKNSQDIELLDKNIATNKEEFDTFKTKATSQMSDMATKKADKTEVQAAQNKADSAYTVANSKQGKLIISSSTTSTSTTQVANSYAVKTTMDKANSAYGKAEQAFQLGDSTKKDVVSILSSKGISGLTTSSTWDQIKSAMGNMSLGKKFAKGGTTLTNPYTLSVLNLDFKPSIILIQTSRGTTYAGYNCVDSPLISYSPFYFDYNKRYVKTDGYCTIKDSGFTCTELFDKKYDYNIPCDWIAIE